MNALIDWWNLGRDCRVPHENQASWAQLIRDDFSQMTVSDKAFASGERSWASMRPLKAFTPAMIRTGPTPLVRQVVERPFRWLKPHGR
jgi:hypothetical protein